MAANTNKDFGVPALPLCSNYYYGNAYFTDLV